MAPSKPARMDPPQSGTAPSELDVLLASAKRGELSWSELAEKMLKQEQNECGSHSPDVDRARRCGLGEVIFGSGKDITSIVQITKALLSSGQCEVLVTRLSYEVAGEVGEAFGFARYDQQGRTLRLSHSPIAEVNPQYAVAHRSPALQQVAVITAGSTDLPVAREALETLRWMGVDAALFTDIGVAGPYRLLKHIEQLRQCVALVVVAGMEGALASVVGGLVPCPVVAVPTSVGYGANFEGITTLLSMMSSCAAGVTVVNIDAGFKGGYVAGLIARQPTTAHRP